MRAKTTLVVWIAGLLVVAGCSTYRGGTTDDYQSGYGATGPLPSGGETVRPGMNSNDIRDPSALTRPIQPNVP